VRSRGEWAQAPLTMTIKRIPYHGWPDSLLLSNGTVEAMVVPALGRVMQFRFAGEESGAFWENRELDGHLLSAETGSCLSDSSRPSRRKSFGEGPLC